LRAIWSVPDTRAKLLAGLAEKGFGSEQMTEMQRIIDAEKSDLFDVLAYVAYALPTLTRDQRADMAKVEISAHFDAKQQAFLNFVLAHYVSEGVRELAQEKLTPLLYLRYNGSMADAVADLAGRLPGQLGRRPTGCDQGHRRRVRLATVSIEVVPRGACRRYDELARNQLGDGFRASPAIAGKALFLRSQSHLYRVEKSVVP